MASGKLIKVRCPKCSESFNYYDSSYRPFCSKRCKEIDLGNWLLESYKVPSKEPLSDNDIEQVLQEQSENGGNEDN